MKPSTALITTSGQAAHRKIADGLRQEILSGKFTPGTRLPSTGELAQIWSSSTFTVHTALTTLVKEGWIERRNGAGTYIADPKNRFLCAGIYHDSDLGSHDRTAFSRNLHFALLQQLERLKKDTQIFTDSRPKKEQGTILPALSEAILHGRIQCLFGLSINQFSAAPLAKLALPTAFLANPFSQNRAEFNKETLFRESARRMKARGGNSIGWISNLVPNTDKKSPYMGLYPLFQRVMQEEGITTRDEWIRRPAARVVDSERYGYQEFKALWNLPEKPDELIVFPDEVARGTILAILELGFREVTRQMKFVFHRNAHLGLLCPFPVTWATSDEDTMAEALVQLVLKQFKGEKTSPLPLPYTFTDDVPEEAAAG